MNLLRIAIASVLLAAPALAQADPLALVTAKELQWTDVAQPKGAKQAALWGDPAKGDNGVVFRWPFGTKLPAAVRSQDVHVVVLAGTFTVDVDGNYKEFGPGGFLSIPKGAKHVFGCEAAGECRFLLHHPGAVEVTPSK